MSRYRIGALVLCVLGGCSVRALPAPVPTYANVEPILNASCLECHGEGRAEGGYRVDGYLAAIACPAGEGPAVEPHDARAPIVLALERPDHAALLTPQQAALLRAWVETGATARIGAAHAPGWVDPRSADFHGAALRGEGFRRMVDLAAPGTCARCHAGTAGTLSLPTSTAPGATACTTCHREPEGPRACSTCHGASGRAYPPRDPCFHPDEGETAGAHEAHAAARVDCAICHGARTVAELGDSLHGNGIVELEARARFDPTTRTCSTTCHDRGGSAPTPTWAPIANLDCGACHESPPRDHYAGTCDRCHREVTPTGDALLPGPLHANGMVDIGDGSGGCGACHGEGDDPTPVTGSHASHAHPRLTQPFACESCHVVPGAVMDAGHLDHTEGAEVTFGALASARGAAPTHAVDGTCADVACHGSELVGGTWTTPRWGDESGLAARCGACHAFPPPAPHTTSSSCSAIACHGGYVAPGLSLTSEGLLVHGNGVVDLWAAP